MKMANFVNMESSRTTTFQESLDQVVLQADENLERLKQVKQQNQFFSSHNVGAAQASSSPFQAIYAPPINSSSKLGISNGRPLSAPRNVPFQRLSGYSEVMARSQQTAFDSKDGRDQTNPTLNSSNSSSSLKNDSILKKMKLLEEKLKKLERQHLSQEQLIQDLIITNERLQESQKQDKKSQTALRDQVSTLKTRLELLVSQQEIGNKNFGTSNSVSNIPSKTDNDWIRDLISRQVQWEVQKALNTNEQGSSPPPPPPPPSQPLAFSPHKSEEQPSSRAQQSSHHTNSLLKDHLTSIEREVLKLNGDIDRMKTKQSYLDRIYSELKENVSARELRSEENHRKSIHNYRVEFDQLLTATHTVINEQIQEMNCNSLLSQENKENLEKHIHNAGKIFAEFDIKLMDVEHQMKQVGNSLALLKSKDADSDSRIKDLQQNFNSISAECEQIYAIKEFLSEQAALLDSQNEKILSLQLQSRETKDAIDSTSAPLKTLNESVNLLGEKVSQKLKMMKAFLDENQKSQDDCLLILRESQRKVKSKLKSSMEQIGRLSALKESVEKVSQEFQKRIHEEASYTYEVQSRLQRLDSRLSSIEETAAKDRQSFPEMLKRSSMALVQSMERIRKEQAQECAMRCESTAAAVAETKDMMMRQERGLSTLRNELDDQLEQINTLIEPLLDDLGELRENVSANQSALKEVQEALEAAQARRVLSSSLLGGDMSLNESMHSKQPYNIMSTPSHGQGQSQGRFVGSPMQSQRVAMGTESSALHVSYYAEPALCDNPSEQSFYSSSAADSLSQFHNMIERVNSDILALNHHLNGQQSSPSVLVGQQPHQQPHQHPEQHLTRAPVVVDCVVEHPAASESESGAVLTQEVWLGSPTQSQIMATSDKEAVPGETPAAAALSSPAVAASVSSPLLSMGAIYEAKENVVYEQIYDESDEELSNEPPRDEHFAEDVNQTQTLEEEGEEEAEEEEETSWSQQMIETEIKDEEEREEQGHRSRSEIAPLQQERDSEESDEDSGNAPPTEIYTDEFNQTQTLDEENIYQMSDSVAEEANGGIAATLDLFVTEIIGRALTHLNVKATSKDEQLVVASQAQQVANGETEDSSSILEDIPSNSADVSKISIDPPNNQLAMSGYNKNGVNEEQNEFEGIVETLENLQALDLSDTENMHENKHLDASNQKESSSDTSSHEWDHVEADYEDEEELKLEELIEKKRLRRQLLQPELFGNAEYWKTSSED